jgi:hypothetical protein
MRVTTRERIARLAVVLDQQHKAAAPIAVIGKRASLRKHYSPKTRGGPLYCGEHELQLRDRTKARELDQRPMFTTLEPLSDLLP